MEELLTQYNLLIDEENYIDALEIEMVLEDKYPNARYISRHPFSDVAHKVSLTEEQQRVLEQRAVEEPAVMYMMGRMKRHALGGFEQNWDESSALFVKAAAAGHMHATIWKGLNLRHGTRVPRDREAGLRCIEETALAGYWGGIRFLTNYYLTPPHFPSTGVSRVDPVLAVQWAFKGMLLGDEVCAARFSKIRRCYSEEICPYGTWRPDAELYARLPDHIQTQVKTTLLVFKHMQISRYLALIVCAYVVTK